MSITTLSKHALILFTCFFSLSLFADRIEVIHLHGRSANEIIPIIQPLLDQDTGLSAQGYKLIVRGSEKTIAQVHQLIRKIDHPPQQLMISVRRGGEASYNRNEISASGTIRSGDGQLSVNGGQQNGVKLHETRGSINDRSIRRIHVTEGRQAFIQTGQQIPVGERHIDQFGHRSSSVTYKNASSGFYVLPRTVGENVNLEVLQNNISLDRHGRQRFNTQRTGTTLGGKLGEWISIGGVTQQSNQSRSGILHSTRRDSNSDSQLYIKVDVIKP